MPCATMTGSADPVAWTRHLRSRFRQLTRRPPRLMRAAAKP
ncbi:hypothetical protein HMPREF3036_01935 [Sutterella sp. KLE1602]|nr:hypothetical protein HMPREF3036_01935 [Sutterella sp. KLE1602]